MFGGKKVTRWGEPHMPPNMRSSDQDGFADQFNARRGGSDVNFHLAGPGSGPYGHKPMSFGGEMAKLLCALALFTAVGTGCYLGVQLAHPHLDVAKANAAQSVDGNTSELRDNVQWLMQENQQLKTELARLTNSDGVLTKMRDLFARQRNTNAATANSLRQINASLGIQNGVIPQTVETNLRPAPEPAVDAPKMVVVTPVDANLEARMRLTDDKSPKATAKKNGG